MTSDFELSIVCLSGSVLVLIETVKVNKLTDWEFVGTDNCPIELKEDYDRLIKFFNLVGAPA
jgi:hypothetical protein